MSAITLIVLIIIYYAPTFLIHRASAHDTILFALANTFVPVIVLAIVSSDLSVSLGVVISIFAKYGLEALQNQTNRDLALALVGGWIMIAGYSVFMYTRFLNKRHASRSKRT